MIKKIMILLFMISSFAFAQLSKSDVTSIIKNNPELLNTPQAQAIIKERGITKKQLLQSNSNINKSIYLNDKVDNNLSLFNIDNNKTNIFQETNETNETFYTNPLEYKSNIKVLKDIRDKQNIVRKLELKRFNDNFFRNKNRINPATLPVPDYYIINKGDTISIWIYGGVNKNINAKVDNNGNINIENFGPIKVAGLRFAKAKKIISTELSHAFNNANVAVNISSYSTIQVVLTGDIIAPGIYNTPSLSTLKDLLIQSGGIKESGSVRNIIIKRNNKIYKIVDMYGLLTGKSNNAKTLLRSGDIVFVPKAKKIVAIMGSIYRPALYELKNNESLYDLIKYANGLKPGASQYGIKIVRYNNHKNLIIKNTDYKHSRYQILKNGDKVYVYSIDKVQKQYIYLYGNVVRPGSIEYKNNMTLHSLFEQKIKQVGLKGVFLNNTLFSYGMIKRRDKNLSTEVVSFNLMNILSDKKDIKLKPNDEIYIFNKLDVKINPYVSISGSIVLKSGKYQYYKGLTVGDLINIAGIKAPYDTSNIEVVTFDKNSFKPMVNSITSKEAKHYKLTPFAEVHLFNYFKTNPVSFAYIKGEVNYPKQVIIDSNTTLYDIIKLAGGLTDKAYKQKCEIVRYYIKNGERKKKIISIPLSKAEDFKINKFDEVTILKIPNWSERETVELKGEVKFPGTYVIESGDKLADVIKRAGGFTKKAFLYGAVFTREDIKKLQRQKLRESLLKLKQKSILLSNSPRSAGEQKGINTLEAANMIDSLSKEAEKFEPIGRITIHLQNNFEKFSKSPSNLTLKGGDKLYVPSFNDTVLVIGEVMNPTAIIYQDGSLETYINKAGGLSELADDSNIYVVHANGEAVKYNKGLFSSSVHIKKGDTIVVPQKLVTVTGMQFAKDVSSILYQFAVTVASLKTVGAF